MGATLGANILLPYTEPTRSLTGRSANRDTSDRKAEWFDCHAHLDPRAGEITFKACLGLVQ